MLRFPYGNHIGEQFGHMLATGAIESDPNTGDPVVYDCTCKQCGKEHIHVLDHDLLGYRILCCPDCDKMNFVGMKFGRLTVIKRGPNNKHSCVQLWCRCSCPEHTVKLIEKSTLVKGLTKSCGCLHREAATHQGHIRGKLNKKWTDEEWQIILHHTSMMTRCYNKNSRGYHYWGGRGITVCDEWRDPINGKLNFIKWAKANGYKPGLSLDRENKGKYRVLQNGPYASWNCRWVTTKEQNNNKRTNVFMKIGDRDLTIAQWAEEIDVDKKWLYKRLGRFGFKWTKNFIYTKLLEKEKQNK